MAMLSAPVINPLPNIPNPPAPANPPAAPNPSQIPVKNLISEECIQRGDELPEERRDILTGQKISITSFPTDADPYIQLPEQYRSQVEYYNYQRPLDLFRFYSDRYWNLLSAYGAYTPTGQARFLPVKYYTVSYGTNNQTQAKWIRGNILPLNATTLYPTVDTNIIDHHVLEKIVVVANENYFEGSGRPDLLVSTQEEAEELFEGVEVADVPGVEQYVDEQTADMLTQEDLREEDRRRREEREREQRERDLAARRRSALGEQPLDPVPEDQREPENTGNTGGGSQAPKGQRGVMGTSSGGSGISEY